MKLWICPTGEHAGLRAPSRMRSDDARRFCLDCTRAAGRLVKRVCPSLERKRAASSAARVKAAKKALGAVRAANERAAAAREARLTAAATVDGVDVRGAAPAMWRALMRVVDEPEERAMPEVVVHRRGSGGGLAYAHVNRVTVSTAGVDLASVLETMLHELTHRAVGCRHGHDRVFNRALHDAAVALWNVDIPSWRGVGYELSRKVERALRLRLDLDEEEVISVLSPVGLSRAT